MARTFKVIVDKDGGWRVMGDPDDFLRTAGTLLLLNEQMQPKPNTTVTVELMSLPRLVRLMRKHGYTLEGVTE
jgi:hypothetical protein